MKAWDGVYSKSRDDHDHDLDGGPCEHCGDLVAEYCAVWIDGDYLCADCASQVEEAEL